MADTKIFVSLPPSLYSLAKEVIALDDNLNNDIIEAYADQQKGVRVFKKQRRE